LQRRQQRQLQEQQQQQQQQHQRRQQQQQQQQQQQAQARVSSLSSTNDLLDQHVEYYLSNNPGVRESSTIWRRRAGCYSINGREVTLDWEHNDPSGGDGFLVVIDGPLRQAFKDYVVGDDARVVYDGQGIRHTNLHKTSEDARVTFPDAGREYTKLEAMKVAKEQAHFRQKAADCMASGNAVPSDLFDNYESALDSKLGKSRQAYEDCKKQWSKKDQQQPGKTKMYPAHAPPGKYSAAEVAAPRTYRERYGS